MPTIKNIRALEILDSRGRPTVLAEITVSAGKAAVTIQASVPSGASTGSAEALELRDGDPKRYGGLGCRKAIDNIASKIAPAIVGKKIDSQEAFDQKLIDLDGTPNKSNLGANAILACSIAFARACAKLQDLPEYQYFANLAKNPTPRLPRLTVNLFSGGKHAGGQVSIQDILVVPASAKSVSDGLAMVYDVYQAAARLCLKKYNMRMLRADEGGLAPPFASVDQALTDAVQSIKDAGYTPGKDVAIALDVASSHFYENGLYKLDGKQLSPSEMIDAITGWVDRYPIVSIEDGLSESDWSHWPLLRAALSGKALTLGDDFLCTNPGRIKKAIENDCADALLLKVNQIGSLTEATQSLALARQANWSVTVSARSGETEDAWLADLAVGWAGEQIKIGSITQSERLAKYNRLLVIEADTGLGLSPWPN
jgi:enolase